MPQPFLEKIIHFIKYNNATLIIAAILLIAGAGTFAAGPDTIGQKETRVEGVDNTVLLSVDLDAHDMDFKIEKIESDEKYYYATFTYLDIGLVNGVWQYEMKEKTIKVTRNLKDDLGVWLAAELADIRYSRIKNLKKEKEIAQAAGPSKRQEVTEYSGLIGKTLSAAGAVFSGYSPVKTKELPTPANLAALTALSPAEAEAVLDGTDNLARVYEEYIAENDPDADNIFGANDNCPSAPNSGQEDSDEDGIGDACDTIDNSSDTTGGSAPESYSGDFASEDEDGQDDPGQNEPDAVRVIELPVSEGQPSGEISGSGADSVEPNSAPEPVSGSSDAGQESQEILPQ